MVQYSASSFNLDIPTSQFKMQSFHDVLNHRHNIATLAQNWISSCDTDPYQHLAGSIATYDLKMEIGEGVRSYK